jgi:SAM-dependent methyltransferase
MIELPNLRRQFEWTTAAGHRIGVECFDLLWDRLLAHAKGRALHVGSKASVLDHAARWRQWLPRCKVTGIDVEAGDNVDVVCDIQAPVSELRRRCGVRAFDAIVCPHVLEHLPEPWVAARNLQYLLRPGGLLLVTVPWVQGYHEFPDDYWRMSFAALRSLLPDIAVELEFYSGAAEDLGFRLLWNGAPEHSPRTCRIERNLFQLMLDEVPEQRIFDDREGGKIALSRLYVPGCSVNLIGRRKG